MLTYKNYTFDGLHDLALELSHDGTDDVQQCVDGVQPVGYVNLNESKYFPTVEFATYVASLVSVSDLLASK